MKGFFKLLLPILVFYSCVPYSSSTSSTSTANINWNNPSYRLVDIGSYAPTYQENALQFRPIKTNIDEANEKFDEWELSNEERESFPYNMLNMEFYDFISGVKHAIIVHEDDTEKEITEGKEYAIDRVNMLKRYLWGIGFENVAGNKDQAERLFNEGMVESYCDVAYVAFYATRPLNEWNKFQYSGGGFIIEGCNGNSYQFEFPGMKEPYYTSYSNFYEDANKVLFTQLTKAFWHNVPKDKDKRMTLIGDSDFAMIDRVDHYDKKGVDSPVSSWGEEGLKSYFDNNRLDFVEGIYESMLVGKNVRSGKYKFGVVKNGDEYLLHYISGANNSDDWEEGSLKAVMKKTATPDFYKVQWFMANRDANDEVYGFIDEYNLLTIRFGSIANEDSDIKYLKLYPVESSSTTSPRNPSIGDFSSSGTGFAISSDGFIVTNYHVIESANKIIVQSSKIGNQKEYNAELVLTDEKNDLAIIKINDDSFNSLQKIPFILKQNISQLGTKVYTLGYPLIDTMGESIKLTDGLISSKMGFQGDVSSYQTSVPVQPGNSGGPLFDYKGNIIGIVNAKHSGADNASYAIKSSALINLIQLLPNPPKINKNNKLNDSSLSEQVEIVEDFIFLIKIK